MAKKNSDTRYGWFWLIVPALNLCLSIVLVHQLFFAGDGFAEDVTGTYNVKSGLIQAKSFDRLPRDVLGTCEHEVGHYVWYELLTDAERAEYGKIHNDSRSAVSFYAVIGGVEEDFAETFKEAVVCGFDPSLVPDDREPFFEGIVAEAWHKYLYLEE